MFFQITNDDMVLPGADGKIVAWVDEDWKPRFFGHFRRFLSTFRKCRPFYVKQEMFFQGAKQITPNEGITYILLPRTTHKKEFSQYTDSWRKKNIVFFSIIFISVLCDNTWGHTYFVETRKIVQIKIKSDEHDNPISHRQFCLISVRFRLNSWLGVL